MTAAEDAAPQVDGAALLDEVHAAITKYVVFADAAEALAVTLWVVATHAVSAFEHATRLVIKSPEKRCGKSRLLEVLSALARRAMMTANISEAALFRSIGDDPPTLFIDEADTIFGTRTRAEQHEGLRGLLNAGFRRGSPTYRVVGREHTPQAFPTFAMACLAGIGAMPDTIEDRAVVISLRRRAAHETVLPYRLRTDEAELFTLRDRIAAWISTVQRELEGAEPTSDLQDRAADTWEPLLAVADAAGGTWPSRARRSAAVLIGRHDALSVDRSSGLRLLADIAVIFAHPRYRDAAFIASADLIHELHQQPDAGWKDEGLTARKLAALLKSYRVEPGHDSTKTQRGYRIAHLTDAICRYLPELSTEPDSADGFSGPEPSGRPDVQEVRASAADGYESTDGSNRPATPLPSSRQPQQANGPDARTHPDSYTAKQAA